MADFRLPSGVTLGTNNSSIAQQYLKYGAVEVIKDEKVQDIPDVKIQEEVQEEPKKRTSRK